MAKITKIRIKNETTGDFDEEYSIGSGGTTVIVEKSATNSDRPVNSGYNLPNNSIWLVVEEV